MHLEFLYLRVTSRVSNYAPQNPEENIQESKPRRGKLSSYLLPIRYLQDSQSSRAERDTPKRTAKSHARRSARKLRHASRRGHGAVAKRAGAGRAERNSGAGDSRSRVGVRHQTT